MLRFDTTWEPLETRSVDHVELSLAGEIAALKPRHYLSIGGLGLIMSSAVVGVFSGWAAALSVFSMGTLLISWAAIVTPSPRAKRNDNWR
ncbi:MAG: hypothetical protein AB7S70_08960 [Hyphomicrobium sp.]|uniref:hypothetical protein n=1 Tax=Hyphomicrobium sp. TaxID=82 RepID=UPI003D11C067